MKGLGRLSLRPHERSSGSTVHLGINSDMDPGDLNPMIITYLCKQGWQNAIECSRGWNPGGRW
jgi:hypothetical protein